MFSEKEGERGGKARRRKETVPSRRKSHFAVIRTAYSRVYRNDFSRSITRKRTVLRGDKERLVPGKSIKVVAG